VTLVTHEKLQSSSKRWSPKVIEFCFIEVSDAELSERLADVGKILYDELSQRPKSLSPDPGMILEQRTTNE
jgi:hypothetical protein